LHDVLDKKNRASVFIKVKLQWKSALMLSLWSYTMMARTLSWLRYLLMLSFAV